MSYLFPMNGSDIGLDRFERVCYQGVQTDDDDGSEQASIEEMREFRRPKPEGCEHDTRDRDGRVDLEIGPDRGPRRPL